MCHVEIRITLAGLLYLEKSCCIFFFLEVTKYQVLNMDRQVVLC